MSVGKAYIAIELPPVHTWRLLRHENELPENFVIIGQLRVGTDERPQLENQSVNRLRKSLGMTPSSSGLCERCPLRARLIESPGGRDP